MSREIFLQEDSLITSKTDLKGKIVYANDDFLKYAGYTMGEVLNKCRRKNKISIWKNKTSIKVEILFFYKP